MTARLSLFVSVLLLFIGCNTNPIKRNISYVNPMIGATTSMEVAGSYHGLGKTFPGATTPYGMVQVSPNTITGGDNGSGYSDEHESIEGFAFTQMSGVGWYGDLGNFLVMPTIGKLFTQAGTLKNPDIGYRSRYDKDSEIASPGYYSVFLSDYKIKVETTAAPHSGLIRFTFPQNKKSRIQIDLARRVGGTSTEQYVKVIDEYTISGWMKCPPEGGGWGNGMGQADYTVYFYAQFSKPLENYGVWSADIPKNITRKNEEVNDRVYQEYVANSKVERGVKEKSGQHLGFFIEFDTEEDEEVFMKTGISFVSEDGAKNNLKSEIKDWDFIKVKNKAESLWTNSLGKIDVKGGSDDDKAVFYTALYHTQIDPRTFSDVDGYYIGGDKEKYQSSDFTRRTIFSGWDVFRSQMPLQTIINPELVTDVINSLITLAEEKDKNYLERWEFLNAYSGCMIGNPAVSVISDAVNKDLKGFDIEKAYELSRSTVEQFKNSELGYTYDEYGISNTLEYAYSDWCMSEMARKLGKIEDFERYRERGYAYKNIFDSDKKWFRPKDKEGNWLDWPDEGRLAEWYGTIESNPYQQGWFVPHDIEGMVTLMGGKEKVKKDLKSFFEKTPQDMRWNDYYNHANEPVHHVAFLFNRISCPWLTQKWSREICNRAYENNVEGLVGNEDVGQMSAWYVLAASGIYPVSPGNSRYEITSPVFNEVTLNANTEKPFVIRAVKNSAENIYIQSAKLNGEIYNRCWIDFSDINKGGILELKMGPRPNKKWGIE